MRDTWWGIFNNPCWFNCRYFIWA